MADNDTSEQYVLSITAQDQASATINSVNAALTQTLAQTQQLTLANEALSAAAILPFEELDTAAQSTLSTLAQQQTAVQDLTDLYAGLAAQEQQAAQAATEAASAGADDSGGGGISLGGGRSALRAGGFLLGADAGGGALRGAGQILTLTAALGPVGVLAGAAAVGLRTLTSAEDAAEKAFQARLDTERQAAHDISTLTTQEVQDKIKAAQSSLEIDQEVNRKQTANAALYTLTIVDQPLKLAAALAGLDPTYNAYQDALAKNGVAIQGDQALIDAYTGAIGDNGTAAADAAVDMKTLSDALVANANKDLEIDRLTKAQRDERAAQDQRDIQLLNDQIQAGGLTEQATYELLIQQGKLYDDYQKVTGVSDTYADQLQREADAKQALTDANQKTLDLLSQEGDVRDKIASTEADIQQTRQDAADKSAQIWSDEAAKIADIQTQGGEKRADIEQNTQDNIAKIQRDSGQDLKNDVALRDAEKYLLDSQKETTQLADQQTNEKKQLDAEAASEAKSIAQAQDAAAKSETNLEQALGKELAAKDRVLLQEQTDLQNILSGELALSQQYGVGILSSTQTTWQGIEAVFNQFGQGIVHNLQAAAYGGATTPVPYSQFSAPGFNSPTPLAPVSGTAAARNVTVNVNGVGMSLGQATNHILNQIDMLF